MITTFLFDIGNVVWFYQKLHDQLLHSWSDLSGLSYDEFYSHYLSYYKSLETNQKTLDDFVEYLHQNDSKQYWQSLDVVFSLENFNPHLNLPLVNLIKNLRQIFKVGYLSNGENYLKNYTYHRVSPYFDFGYSSFDLGLEKPNPEFFQKALELQNLKPTEVIFIDDILKNTESAQSLGINSILFENNSQLLSELRKIQI